jgi:transcriptional regulator PpsR
VKAFKAPRKSLGNLNAEAAAALITAAADVALVLDGSGTIRDIAFNSEDLATQFDGQRWLGVPWVATVTEETRPKIELLVQEAGSGDTPRWRQVNHLSVQGESIPVLYAAVQVGASGRLVAFGRDLRPVSALQQRLVAAQQAMERDYSRLRQVEARYRLLFEMSAEPVLIVDAPSLKVLEANGAARRVLGAALRRGSGAAVGELFAPESRGPVQALLGNVRGGGRADDLRARLVDGGREVEVAASLFRQDANTLFLVRLGLVGRDSDGILLPRSKAKILKLIEAGPDACVVTDQNGVVVSCNTAMLEMCQVATEELLRGESLGRWLGRQSIEFDVLLGNLKGRGPVRLFAAGLRGEFGARLDVEVSAASFRDGAETCFGFLIRDVGMRPEAIPAIGREMPRSVEQLTELIGRVPLKDLVREATDVIERMCIEAALNLTNDNRASAAEMLGLSRQSLYVKLRRYNLGDLGEPAGDEPDET